MFALSARSAFWLVIVGAAMLGGSAGCGGKPPAADGAARAAGEAESHSSKESRAAVAGNPVPPQEARWTIYCRAIAGPGHIEQARRIRDELVKTSGMPDWHLLHKEQESVIYYGFYREYAAREGKDGARAQADLKRVDALTDANGGRPFMRAYIVPLDSPDPEAPPEWDLLNSGGYWTLAIATYRDHPDRKRFAVDAVREARAHGVEAYYYHGEIASTVCVGAWPRDAVKEQQSDDELFGGDPEQPLLVLPQPMPVPKNLRDSEGRPYKTLAPRFEPMAPSLLTAMQKFPEHAVNGELVMYKGRDRRTGKQVSRPMASYVTMVPQRSESMLGSGAEAIRRAPGESDEVVPPPAPSMFAPATPSGVPGSGRLKSIGE